jgi:predicted double-glycine peptidase
MLKTRGYFVPKCADTDFISQVNNKTKELLFEENIWFTNREIKNYSNYNGDMIYNALEGVKETRKMLPDKKLKGVRGYAT